MDKIRIDAWLSCGGCGENLTVTHWMQCRWVPCRCGHLRSSHDDGCTWISGRGLRCPCEKFTAGLTYEEFREWSERLASADKRP